MARSTDGETGAVLTTTSEIVVLRETMFNGVMAFEAEADVQARSTTHPEINSDSTTREYYTVDVPNRRFRFHGIVTETVSPLTTTITVTNNPGWLERYDLDAGASFDQQYDSALVTDIPSPFPGVPGGSTTVDSTVDRTTTYHGREQVTVPAGTFDACKFTDVVSTTTDASGTGPSTDTSTTTRWMAVGSGIFLKSISGGDENVTVSYSIDGVPVTGL